MSDVKIQIIDSFSKEPFAGNPAAVCCLDCELPDHVMQKIAAEMNLSETAFVVTMSAGASFTNANVFGLRWFTPVQEVDLCGHATLATAAVIYQQHGNKFNELEFQSRSGVLKARKEEDSSITLNFPSNPPSPFNPSDVNFIRVIVKDLEVLEVQYSSVTKKLLVRLDDKYNRTDLEFLKPSPQEMTAAETTGTVKGVIVTLKAKKGEAYDFYSRYFAPWVGIPEDPVTGSAHTVLGPYWQQLLKKDHLKARQCSKRGGDLDVRIKSNRVELTGHAVLVLNGTIRTS